MAQVKWSEHSLRDLEVIYYFIARDSPVNAASIIIRAQRTVERLGEFPRSGRVVPEVGREEIREVIVQNYRVIYRVLPDEVEILTVHHGARLLRPQDFSPD